MIIIVAVQIPLASAQYNSGTEINYDYYFGSVEVVNEPENIITIMINEDYSAKISMILNIIKRRKVIYQTRPLDSGHQ